MAQQTTAGRFFERFRGLTRAHGTYNIENADPTRGGKVEGRASTKVEEVTEALWAMHLAGRQGLGIVPITDEGTCRFGAIDVDIYDGLDLAKVEADISRLGLPLVVCRTKSGGAHLYLFLGEQVKAKTVRHKLMEWAVALGYPNPEIFPKQNSLAGEDDVGGFGCWINMPYFAGDRTTRYAIRGGSSLSAEEFLDQADAVEISAVELEAVRVQMDELLEDAPPCLQFICADGVPEGARNNAVFNLGVYAKKRHGDAWAERLDEMNRKYLEPPLSSAEVLGVIKSLKKKDYGYKCGEPPLRGACNRQVCLARAHGVGGESNDPGITLLGLTRIDTVPPTWIVDVEGYRIELRSTEDLISQEKFRRACVEKMNLLPTKIKPPAWDRLIQRLLEKVEVIEAPEDAGPEGQFMYLVEQFCADRAQARDREELLIGKPWTDGGMVYFRSGDLMKFLDHNRFREVSNAKEAWSILRKNGADNKQFNVKGKCVKTWCLPVFARQDEPFGVPEPPDDAPF